MHRQHQGNLTGCSERASRNPASPHSGAESSGMPTRADHPVRLVRRRPSHRRPAGPERRVGARLSSPPHIGDPDHGRAGKRPGRMVYASLAPGVIARFCCRQRRWKGVSFQPTLTSAADRHVFLVLTFACARAIQAWQQGLAPKAGALYRKRGEQLTRISARVRT